MAASKAYKKTKVGKRRTSVPTIAQLTLAIREENK